MSLNTVLTVLQFLAYTSKQGGLGGHQPILDHATASFSADLSGCSPLFELGVDDLAADSLTQAMFVRAKAAFESLPGEPEGPVDRKLTQILVLLRGLHAHQPQLTPGNEDRAR